MVAVCFPLIYYLFNFTMMLSGYRYLTAENVAGFLRHPQIYLFILAVLFLIMLLSAFDLGGVVFIADLSWRGEKTDLLDTLRFAAENTRELLKPARFRTGLVPLLASVLFSLGMIPSAVSRATLADFITRRLKGHPAVITLIVAAAIFFIWLFLNHMYEFHFVSVEGCTSKEARQNGRKLGKNRKLSDFLAILAVIVVYYLIYVAAIALGLLAALLIRRVFAWSSGLHFLSETAAFFILAALMIVFTVIATPVGYLGVSLRYERHREEEGGAVRSVPLEKSRFWKKEREEKAARREQKAGRKRRLTDGGKRKLVSCILLAVSLFSLPLYIWWAQHGYTLNVEYLHRMQVTAHRGASRYYPENTMAAFRGAVDQGADWIELDVHESSDGQIFVMHDSSFRRTTGTDKSAWELSYDEISSLDAGSYFSSEYAGEKIPLLSDVIDFAKEEKIPLNIEIKPSGHEKTLEYDLVQLLEEKNFISQCVVTSQSYASISKVKDLNPDIKTIYVMGFAYGNIGKLTKADGFSVRYTSVTRDLVSRVHNAGKEIFAWTVNSRWAIDDMIDRQVDNIITDNVPLARSRIDKNQSGDLFSEYLRLLNDLI